MRTGGSRNKRPHGVSFEEAQELFRIDSPVLEVYDLDHTESEDRFKSIGPIRRGLVLVVWTERSDDASRINSARWTTASEQEMYVESRP